MNYKELCGFISYFRGEMANEYATHYEYVESGDWEKDYFANWLKEQLACGEGYPSLKEIEDFCQEVQYYIGHWFAGVEAGKIDSEAGVEE